MAKRTPVSNHRGSFFARSVPNFSHGSLSAAGPRALAPQRFFPGSQSGNCQPGFPRRSRQAHFFALDIRKGGVYTPPLFCSAANRNVPRQHHFTALTQQNLCYFVAFVRYVYLYRYYRAMILPFVHNKKSRPAIRRTAHF